MTTRRRNAKAMRLLFPMAFSVYAYSVPGFGTPTSGARHVQGRRRVVRNRGANARRTDRQAANRTRHVLFEATMSKYIAGDRRRRCFRHNVSLPLSIEPQGGGAVD